MKKAEDYPPRRRSLTLTLLLWSCAVLIIVGLISAVLGIGEIVVGPIEIFGAKISHVPVGIALVVLGGLIAVALLRAWPRDWGEAYAEVRD
jgi:hypothetical protein